LSTSQSAPHALADSIAFSSPDTSEPPRYSESDLERARDQGRIRSLSDLPLRAVGNRHYETIAGEEISETRLEINAITSDQRFILHCHEKTWKTLRDIKHNQKILHGLEEDTIYHIKVQRLLLIILTITILIVILKIVYIDIAHPQ
jgi:hypothetical protein